MSGALYSIDTSALLDAHEYYPEPHFPLLWSLMDDLIDAQRVRFTREVYVELEKKEHDKVYAWARKRRAAFEEVDEQQQLVVLRILERYPSLGKRRHGASIADPFVIAHAACCDAVVISHEGRDSSEKRPKIPLVCDALGIRCERFPWLIARESWVFGSR